MLSLVSRRVDVVGVPGENGFGALNSGQQTFNVHTLARTPPSSMCVRKAGCT